ncbi:hypothetical protein HOLleu_26598 [Holothuria leucospilota]|uniref:Uncharacterized protein n=1 Tax=Holothuria leucospilota TaxID=206669 RepID=A0A9Q1BP34_HOLLE|nr:hypothetical protein HOLleu_26598 [Holothuria leucospilota]
MSIYYDKVASSFVSYLSRKQLWIPQRMLDDCLYVYTSVQKEFLKEGTIAIVPHQGYNPRCKQSVKALKWLRWIEQEEGIVIKHARQGGQKRIDQYRVDGFHGNHVYEFYGCVWHGCPTCRSNREACVPGSDVPMEETYHNTTL